MDEPVRIVVEPPLPQIVVVVENIEDPVPLPNAVGADISEGVTIVAGPEPSPIEIVVSDVGLPGRNGKDGLPGRDGKDGLDATDVGGAVHTHIHDATPHPVYDDAPSLVLLYHNAKV